MEDRTLSKSNRTFSRLRFLSETVVVIAVLWGGHTLINLIQEWVGVRSIYIGVQGTWVAVAAAGLLMWLSRTRWREVGLRLPERWARTLALVLMASVTYLAVSWSMTTAVLPSLGISVERSKAVDAYYQSLIQGQPLQMALMLVLVVWSAAAVGEELLCRGFLFNRFERVFADMRFAIGLALVMQALAFGVFHYKAGLPTVVSSTVAGLVFGGLYLATNRNLVACILAHGLVNTAYMTAYYFGGTLN